MKGEVNGCDAVAVRDGPLELKRGFSLDVLLRALSECVVQMRSGWLSSDQPQS